MRPPAAAGSETGSQRTTEARRAFSLEERCKQMLVADESSWDYPHFVYYGMNLIFAKKVKENKNSTKKFYRNL